MQIEDLIGNTPLVEIKNIAHNPNVQIFCKLEGQNPGGSVKDRAALGMIGKALERGNIKRGDHLVEATSGNTGIALAMIAQQKGLEITLIMPENSTKERVQTMKAFAANVILTKAEGTIEYSRTVAEQMANTGKYFMLNQFANEDNFQQHYETTGPEIYRDTNGAVSHFVSAMGTTGTIMGVSRYLKEKDPTIKIVGTQPKDGSSIPGIRRWSPEFLPKIYDPKRVDQIIDVSEEESRAMTKIMAKQEGIFAGMSSGGALTAAIKLADTIDTGLIVCITCDRGDRYLSSDLFDD